jgi:hypothetical protein
LVGSQAIAAARRSCITKHLSAVADSKDCITVQLS